MDFSILVDIQVLFDECDIFIEDVIVLIEVEDDNIWFFDYCREDVCTDWERDGLFNVEWEVLLGCMCREVDVVGLLCYQLFVRFGGREGSNFVMVIV